MDARNARKGILLLGRAGYLGLRAGDAKTIGALLDCALSVQAEHVSGRHCEILVDESDRCFVRDLGSTNGTLVNGRTLQPHSLTELADGDVVDLREGVTYLVVSFPLENFEKFFAS